MPLLRGVGLLGGGGQAQVASDFGASMSGGAPVHWVPIACVGTDFCA